MTKPKIIIMAITAFVIITMLFLPPLFGKADDGSFFLTLTENGLYNLDGADTSYFCNSYGISPSANGQNGFFPITIAKVLGGFWSTSIFDIRFLALLYVPFYLIGVYLIIKAIHIKNPIAEIGVCALAAIMFCDIGYISYMNSFYTDALYMCAMLLMVGSIMNMHRGDSFYIPCAVLFVLAAALMAVKGIYGAAAALVGAVVLGISAFMDERTKKSVLTAGVCGVLAAVLLCGLAPDYTDGQKAAYSAVFEGAVREREGAEEKLAKLGISEKYADFAGKSFYEVAEKNAAELASFKKEEAGKISDGKMFAYYMSNPSDMMSTFSDAGKNAPFLTQSYIKTSANTSYGIKHEPGVWSWLRRFATPASFLIWLLIALAVTVVSIATFKKEPLRGVAGILLSFSSILFFIEPILKGGLSSISRNLFMHQLAGDLMILVALCYCINLALEKRHNLQKKYGVNQ